MKPVSWRSVERIVSQMIELWFRNERDRGSAYRKHLSTANHELLSKFQRF